jgi:hypothetical protein
VEAFAFALFWGLALFGFFSKEKHALIFILFGSMAFGSFAVFPPAMTGGLSFTAPPIVVLMIIGRTFLIKGGLDTFFRIALDKQQAMLLFLFWVVATVVTLFMPRFFHGEVMVIPVRAEDLGFGVPLEPTTQNISQLVYMSISVVSALAFSVVLRDEKIKQVTLKAICVGAGVAIFTGFLDFINQFASIDFILEGFRNASYTLLTEAGVGSSSNAKRIVGLMPEASAFGSLCLAYLTFLYFARISIEDDYLRERIAPVIIVLLVGMAWLSTSSAAYVGLGFFGFLAIVEWFWRYNKSNENPLFKRGLTFQLWLINAGIIGLLLAIAFAPSIFDPVLNMIDEIVLQKTDSSSFEERSMWTAVSWQAFIDSYGMGVGIGSTRSSNGAVAMISNVGAIAAIFYYGFLIHLVFRKAPKGDLYGGALISAAKWSYVPSFVIDFLISTTADFGVFNAFRYGLILAIAFPTLSNRFKPSYTKAYQSNGS